MGKALVLTDYYNSEQAFHDPDRMIRIAAVQHSGPRLERNARLRAILLGLLTDKDELVARYAAITLAQQGDAAGITMLLREAPLRSGPERERLDGCLRNCTRFPFAVLVNEITRIESLSSVPDKDTRDQLEGILTLTAESFYDIVKEDASFRPQLIQLLAGLDRVPGVKCRPDTVYGPGWILSVPMGKQPGFLCCPERRMFLTFAEEAVLNPEALRRGVEVLFVTHHPKAVSAEVVYVLEDARPRQDLLPAELLAGPPAVAGLRVGVVVDIKGDKPPRAVVLTACGKPFTEKYRAQKAAVGQLALVEEETDLGRPQCHFVPLGPYQAQQGSVVRLILERHGQHRGLTLARVSAVHEEAEGRWPLLEMEDASGRRFSVRAPRGRKGESAFVHPCNAPRTCFRCEGTGQRQGPNAVRKQPCVWCDATGTLSPCAGKGQAACPACKRTGNCEKCAGSGSCPNCRGSGNCPRCGGTGTYGGGGECYGCNGNRKCRWCSGHKKCTRCQGAGDCSLCRGQTTVKCLICDGTGWNFDQRLDCL
jgi:hypothetical protein